jgi:CheY-like chemotaxis protein
MISVYSDENLIWFKGQRILLVDDNPTIHDILTELLEAVGMQITKAWNGLEALDLVGQEDYDLILMDLDMPIMDGLTATRKIRRMGQPCFQRVPILAITGRCTSEDIDESLSAGMNDHISKPFTPEHLYMVIRNWLMLK